MLKEIRLVPSSIINNLMTTSFSCYNSMTPRYCLQQPRRILESEFLKHIKDTSEDDKIKKYRFLSINLNLYNHLNRFVFS